MTEENICNGGVLSVETVLRRSLWIHTLNRQSTLRYNDDGDLYEDIQWSQKVKTLTFGSQYSSAAIRGYTTNNQDFPPDDSSLLRTNRYLRLEIKEDLSKRRYLFVGTYDSEIAGSCGEQRAWFAVAGYHDVPAVYTIGYESSTNGYRGSLLFPGSSYPNHRSGAIRDGTYENQGLALYIFDPGSCVPTSNFFGGIPGSNISLPGNPEKIPLPATYILKVFDEESNQLLYETELNTYDDSFPQITENFDEIYPVPNNATIDNSYPSIELWVDTYDIPEEDLALPWQQKLRYISTRTITYHYDPDLNETPTISSEEFNNNSLVVREYSYFSNYTFFKRFETLPDQEFPKYTIVCPGCPPNTCSVLCGDTVCCYGSDGVAISSYPLQ